MNRLVKIFISCLLSFILLVCLFPLSAFACSGNAIIDLNKKSDFSGKGWSWDFSEKQLTMKNAKIKETIILPEGSDVNILLEGENTVGGILRDYRGDSREEEFETFDVLDQGDITIVSRKGGAMKVTEYFCVYGNGMLTIDNCLVSVNDFHTSTDMKILNNGTLLFEGYGYSKDLTLDRGTLKNKISDKIIQFHVAGNLNVENESLLSLRDTSEKNPNSVLDVIFDMKSDASSQVTVINTCTENSASAVSFHSRTRLILLLSEKLHLSTGGDEAIFILTEKHGTDLILPEEIQNNYKTSLKIQANQWYYTTLMNHDEKIVKNLMFQSDNQAARTEKIIKGIENTEITLKSSFTTKGNIHLNWEKSPGYRVDYYEVFRSVKRNSGYSQKPFFTTCSSTKNDYTNTSVRPGIRYYYKVRGVREIDGMLYYTQWSNKAWRTARS